MPKGYPKFSVVADCAGCGVAFSQSNHSHKYCCASCRRKQYRRSGAETTEKQYALINGNWEKYFRRLCTRSFNRANLSVPVLMTIKEKQKGLCALSGVEMTCLLQKGVVSKTNASIDRIDPKGPYIADNVHLVCAVLNKFRVDTPLNEFINWCKKVAEHAICK